METSGVKQPRLSILIPSIPDRFGKAIALYNKLIVMAEGKDIEIIMLVDNKCVTIGEKRNLLKNMAHGKYWTILDDDDELLSLDEIYKETESNVDVISYKQRCYNPDGSEFIITFGLNNYVEHNSKDGNYIDSKRPPFHNNVWSERFKIINFPFVSYGEDAHFAKFANMMAKTEIHIDKVLHSYNFHPDTTEASVESNEIWTNPTSPDYKPDYSMAPPPKKAIVCLSTNSKYEFGLNRLRESLVGNFDGEFFGFTSEDEAGAPKHENNPYAFKIYAIQKVREMGFDQILWLDASVVAVKPVQPVFDWMQDKGIFLEEAGHHLGRWMNQKALNYFKITREDCATWSMLSAGFIGFDFRNSVSIEFFAEWDNAMKNGCFIGSWDTFRHDMSIASAIANRRGLVKDYSHGGKFFCYIGPGYSPPLDTVCFHLLGL